MQAQKLCLPILLLALFGTQTLFAYTWNKCGDGANLKWQSNSITLFASSKDFPIDDPYRNAITEVAARWNAVPSLFHYNLMFEETTVGLNNGASEIWWQANQDAAAITYWWYNGDCHFVEGDMVFHSSVSYSPYNSKKKLISYGGDYRPFRTAATHEFGHLQGLAHTNNTYSVMGQDWTHIRANGRVALAYPGEDAASGSVSVYGIVPGKEDVGVTHWRYTGSNGEYSIHGRTRLFNNVEALQTAVSSTKEPIYFVSRGQVVRPEFTYENMGSTSPITVIAYYYISADSVITKRDRKIGSASWTLYRDTVNTSSKVKLHIPLDLKPGQTYWLGVILDPHNAIAETYKNNNSSYLALRVK